jgi:hypothetical protein
MKVTSSPAQVSVGVAFGLALQPISLGMVGVYVQSTTVAGTEARGWDMMGLALLYWLYFGMAQVLTILPAALILLPTGKHGIVRGLLYVGTFLALANIAILIAVFAGAGPPFP